MTPEMKSQCIMKFPFKDWKDFFISEVKIVHLLRCELAGDELVKLLLGKESEGGTNITKTQSSRFW